MKTNSNDSSDHKDTVSRPPLSRSLKVLRAAGWCVVGIAGLMTVSLGAITFYLTPQRLSRIVSQQASKYLNADVAVHNMQFTIWSSFPHFWISADSIRVTSHTLDNIPDSIAKVLPPDRAFLGSTHSLHGSINLAELITGRISLRNVTVDSLRVNLVAFNDSINNYNIVPEQTSMPDKVPYITANIIQLTHPQPLTYFNASAATTVDTRLKSASLHREEEEHNTYRLTVDGKADMTVGQLQLLRQFPFNLSGLVHLGFDPLRVRMTDYAVSLADVKGHLSLNAQLDGNVKVSSMSYSIASFHPLEVLRYLMPTLATQLDAMSANVDVMAQARLTATWHPSVQPLPSLEIDVDIPSGTASYTVQDEGTYTLDDIDIEARLVFDGNNPAATYITVPSMRLRGDGLSADISARLDNITTSPKLQADIQCSTNLEVIGSMPMLRPYNLSGLLNADTKVECNLDALMANPLLALYADGEASVSHLQLRPAAIPGLTIKADEATLAFQTEREGDSDICRTVADIALNRVNMKASSVRADMKSIDIKAVTEPHPTLIDAPLPVNLSAWIHDADFKIPSESITVALGGFSLKASAPDLRRLTEGVKTTASLNRLNVNTTNTHSRLHDLKLNLDVHHTKRYVPHTAPLKLHADSEGLKGTRHTPLYLIPSLSKTVSEFLRNNAFNASLKASGGEFITRAIPNPSYLYALDLRFDNNKFNIHNLRLRAGDTGMDMHGTISGLRDFMLSKRPVPLDIGMNVALDTININRLARLYERSMILAGDTTVDKPAVQSPPQSSDSVAIMIPRNINARIKASAKETVYTDLYLYDLTTDINVHDGVADINPLHIAAAFGEADIKLRYATDDIQAMGLSVSLDSNNINVASFFQNFHTLLLMMPQMKNLSGYITANMEGNFSIFPDMYANLPSLQAAINIKGRELKVHQSDFIRRLTRMLLIRTDEDLHINDIDIRAVVHDNLIELYPFTFQFDSYRLSMAGLNNLQGKMYYHLGVEKSPLHIPFGINIVGNFNHPELRFGGPHFKVNQATDITSHIVTPKTFNVVKEARYYIHEFVRKAAQAAEDTASATHTQPKTEKNND
ncbi:MAG: AsmA-like C-terminal region-containing protein [Muribaculaceae bacterium]|nr:AsmA-like C-terminal region-containing protein [Muribaculaceae bacterium]